MLKCPDCGHESPDGLRFCGACGHELEPAAAPRQVRKTVTVLFCDVTGSTALGERLDPEALRRTMGRYFEEIRAVVERHGGLVEKFIGDAVMAVFGIPTAHEDDALRAVRAVGEMRERLLALGEELAVTLSFRTGVNTGEVVAGEGETLVTGDAVNVAARLEQAATPGEILIGAETYRLVRDAVTVEPVEPLELKGKGEPVPAYRLVSVDPMAPGSARHLDAPMVGRVREQARLLDDFEDVVSGRSCHLFTLLGPAGVGKSRLVHQFLSDVAGRAEVWRSRCLHYGEDITYWPLVEMLIPMGAEPDAVIGASPAETQLAFRRLLEDRAADEPQILLLDDLHWAEPVFLDLVEHVADWSRDAPILLLCVARPELLEVRPGWGGGKLNATTVLLEPLSAEDSDALIEHLSVGAELSEEARGRIVVAAGGNPLFLEEMLAMASENGQAGSLVIPPTIQALLQARLDRLSAGEREVVGCGAVEGQVFHGTAVAVLADDPMRPAIPANLLSLVRKELIRPERPMRGHDEAFRFRHLLIRDAAYDSLPKGTRAELHERFAGWLEGHGELVELEEIVGYHLEQAHRNRTELDPSDPRRDDLAGRAAAMLHQAARKATAQGVITASLGLLERSLALLAEARSTTVRWTHRSDRSAVPGRKDRGRPSRSRRARPVGRQSLPRIRGTARLLDRLLHRRVRARRVPGAHRCRPGSPARVRGRARACLRRMDAERDQLGSAARGGDAVGGDARRPPCNTSRGGVHGSGTERLADHAARPRTHPRGRGASAGRCGARASGGEPAARGAPLERPRTTPVDPRRLRSRPGARSRGDPDRS